MIDEKEKQDGMKACFDRRIEVERGLMRDPLISYTRAFDDAIGWFKKAIWHTEKEIPKSGKLILVKGWYTNVRSEDYTLINTDIDLNYDDIASCDQKLRWEYFCESAKGNLTWCYIEDLLPKGGEK